MLDVNATVEFLNEVMQIVVFGSKRVVDIVKATARRTVSALKMENHVRHPNKFARTAPILDPSNLVCNCILIEVVLVDVALVALATRDNDI